MAIIQWRNEYRTGHPAVDHEHEQLIGEINSVYQNMRDGPPEDETLRGLGEIYAHISAHFALEEVAMRKQRYDDYEPHKEDHENLLDQIRDIMDAYEAGVFANQRDAFGANLEAWFTRHFGTMDARLHKIIGDDH